MEYETMRNREKGSTPGLGETLKGKKGAMQQFGAKRCQWGGSRI